MTILLRLKASLKLAHIRRRHTKKTDYTSGDTDITVTYDGHSYLFSDAFICVDGKYYNPDLSVKQQLTTIYDSLTETAVSSQDGDILIEGED